VDSYDTSAFLPNPDTLVELIRQLIHELQAGRGIPGFEEKTTQLKEIARTITKLEGVGVSVPDELRRLKLALITELSSKDESLIRLEAGLTACRDELRALLGKPAEKVTRKRPDARKPKKRIQARGPKKETTNPQVLREQIVIGLRALGGSAHIGTVLDYVGKALEAELLPGDLERRSKGVIVWRNNAAWERLRMVKDGILKQNSPKGIWELSEDHR
jgi:hypothetical protein